MPSNEQVSYKIRELRKRINLSQERFARKIGLSGKTISAYESGRCVPPLRVLDKISSVYGETFLSVNQEDKISMVEKLLQMKKYLQELEKILS